MANFPTSITTFPFTPTAGKALPYTEPTTYQAEIAAIETTLINSVAQAQAFNSTTQSLTTATLTAITFDSEDYDVGAMHSTSSNTSRFTVPTGLGGVYAIDAKIVYAANATGVRVARLRKNGADVSTQVTLAATAGASQTVGISSKLKLAAGDYIEVWGFQDSGGNLNTGDATNRYLKNELSIVRQW